MDSNAFHLHENIFDSRFAKLTNELNILILDIPQTKNDNFILEKQSYIWFCSHKTLLSGAQSKFSLLSNVTKQASLTSVNDSIHETHQDLASSFVNEVNKSFKLVIYLTNGLQFN
ncbi:CLUMA_CG003839, isoform A [Clunio marinus]|uniref:CLUMA_CG003839, isoform A n=1 Tax=Clunio marinus TaxID=568069 RepID=A0A1J1HVD6_9DIPT|nr:CLUMA_CG003839, isoform A [Clunio marinus]